MRHNRENDPERDRNAGDRSSEPGRSSETIPDRTESDLGRAQADGNLGNERTRDRANDRDDMDDNRDV